MSLTYKHDGLFRLFSDGEDLLLPTEHGVYLIKNPCLRGFDMVFNNNIRELESLGGYREFMPGLPELSVDCSFVGGVAEFWDGKDPRAYILQKYTVRELLKGVNSKLGQR